MAIFIKFYFNSSICEVNKINFDIAAFDKNNGILFPTTILSQTTH